jgi:hypothetical protein
MIRVEVVGLREGARVVNGVQNLAQQTQDQTQELVQQFLELLDRLLKASSIYVWASLCEFVQMGRPSPFLMSSTALLPPPSSR